MNAIVAAYLAMSVLLAVSGLVIVYPAVAGVQVVVYRRAVFALGASILLFVGSWLVVFLTVFDVVDEHVITLVSLGGNLVAGVLHFVAVWWFARDFVELGHGDIDIDAETSTHGGFADEQD